MNKIGLRDMLKASALEARGYTPQEYAEIKSREREFDSFVKRVNGKSYEQYKNMREYHNIDRIRSLSEVIKTKHNKLDKDSFVPITIADRDTISYTTMDYRRSSPRLQSRMRRTGSNNGDVANVGQIVYDDNYDNPVFVSGRDGVIDYSYGNKTIETGIVVDDVNGEHSMGINDKIKLKDMWEDIELMLNAGIDPYKN